jgi:hypothetical protein
MVEESLKKYIQRALDYQEIQNVMSLHEYYHSVDMHKEEFEQLFAQKTPGVSFESQLLGRFEGTEAVRKAYVDGLERLKEIHFKEMRETFPDIKFDKENKHAGFLSIHTLTTPIIEVAEDGKTAKGLWISPGALTSVANGKLEARWIWEKYAVDFVKEDGKWKYWHFSIYTDFNTPYEKSWVENYFEPRPPAEPVPEELKANRPSTFKYQEYSPYTQAKLAPRPPEPYRTFKETFSY